MADQLKPGSGPLDYGNRLWLKILFGVIFFMLYVPIITLVIRRCYGMAGMATRDRDGLDFKIAWPSAEWGSLPIEGGAAAAYKREIEAAPDPAVRLREIEAELIDMASPFRSAEAFVVEDVIDPRETRPYLITVLEAAQSRLATTLGLKPRYGTRP